MKFARILRPVPPVLCPPSMEGPRRDADRVPRPRGASVFVAKAGKLGHENLQAAVAAIAAAIALTGCGMPGAPQPPSLNLPNRVTNLAAVRTGDQVALTWKMPLRNTDKTTLKGSVASRVCRNENGGSSCNAVATLQLAPGAETSYTDTLPSALASGSPRAVSYFIELVNRKNRSAGLSNAAEILAGQAPAAVTGLAAEVRKDGVVLHWAPTPSESQPTTVRLVRTLVTPPAKHNSESALSSPPEPTQRNFLVDPGTSGRALDADIHFGDSYEYRAQRIARISKNGRALELAGPLSAPIRVDAADIFPPTVPQGLAAVATAGENGNQPAIDLSWQPDTDPDLAGYIVYRSENGGDWQQVSPAQPAIEPSFHDPNVQMGHSYMYAVSAIGRNGQESTRSARTEESVPGP